MELLFFIWDQFKVPIIGVTVLALLAWLRFSVPVRRVPSKEMEQYENVKDSGEA